MTLEEQIAALQAENTELQSHIHVAVKEIARLNNAKAGWIATIKVLTNENRSLREGSTRIVAALDAAVQLTESLIMFMPVDGQVIPPDIVEMKTALNEALAAIGVRK